jgi:hypothetical protein
MKLAGLKTIAVFFLAAAVGSPAFGVNTALPGTINYVEGQAQVGSEMLNSKSVGSADLQTGQTLSTEKGRTELLLTPGVFLRLDNNSSAKMLSPSLTDTRVEIEKGRAIVEVAELHKQNNIEIAEDGTSTRLLKNGIYEFDADNGQVKVFDGKAQVEDKDNGVELKGGREFALNSDTPLKAKKFDRKQSEDDFYNWNSLRSEYESEANLQTAAVVPSGFVGPGWWWDPYFSAYTFIPGNGYFISPFGWGFYSPAWVPYYYGVPYRYGPYHWRSGHYDHVGAVPPSVGRPAPPMVARGPAGFGGMHGGRFAGRH